MCISVTTPVTPLSYSPFLPSTPSTLASSEDAPLPYFPYYGYTACLLVRGPPLGHGMTVEQDRRNRRNLLSCWYKNPPENPRMASHPRRHVLLFDTRSSSCIKPCACCTRSSRQGRFLCGVGLLPFPLLLPLTIVQSLSDSCIF